MAIVWNLFRSSPFVRYQFTLYIRPQAEMQYHADHISSVVRSLFESSKDSFLQTLNTDEKQLISIQKQDVSWTVVLVLMKQANQRGSSHC